MVDPYDDPKTTAAMCDAIDGDRSMTDVQQAVPVAHEYGPSRVGHGEAQCIYCLGTNRENAVIAPDECSVRLARLTEPARKADRLGEGVGELRPCPFCGGPGKLIHPMGAWVGGEEGYGPDGSRIVCATDSCGMIAGKSFYGPDQDAEAKSWWNRRTALPDPTHTREAELLSALEAAFEALDGYALPIVRRLARLKVRAALSAGSAQ